MFLGVNSSLVGMALVFLLEALEEACLTAQHHGFIRVLWTKLAFSLFGQNK